MARKSLDELQINESNIANVTVVKDDAGREYVCNLDHLVPASEVDEQLLNNGKQENFSSRIIKSQSKSQFSIHNHNDQPF
ncbi:MAG: hypothetical protein K9K79_04975 [Desulfohalobiaceae bacterium]|nr:hypothetical protein [Desulfohalobiaceae bacterium]